MFERDRGCQGNPFGINTLGDKKGRASSSEAPQRNDIPNRPPTFLQPTTAPKVKPYSTSMR